MSVAIIQYNAGNTLSVYNALLRLNIDAVITDDAETIKNADKVILPGVGAAGSSMRSLQAKQLDILISELTQPVLGICLGMQLLCIHSEEDNVPCLGIFDIPVKKFTGSGKIPHIGWNSVYALKSGLFNGIEENEYMYFVHSFYVPSSENTISTTEYLTEYSSAIQKNNFYGVQFHPEKSGDAGQKILSNFLSL